METQRIADTWREITNIYNETRTEKPKHTLNTIIKKIGIEDTKEVFATIARIKEKDGRIQNKNREYLRKIAVNPDATAHNNENPIIYAGLDKIHSAHIDQLITEMRMMEL